MTDKAEAYEMGNEEPELLDLYHIDRAEMSHKMMEAARHMEEAHRTLHDFRPTDWRWCSQEPCSAVFSLIQELELDLRIE